MRVRYLVICAGALAWASLTGWAGPATRPAGSAAGKEPTTRPADRLGPFIRAVRTAERPRAAMTAYARGCAIDRGKAELHDAYMRRMLTFGLPQIAYYPARVLVRLDPSNGLAWAVVGYTHGKRGELAEAFSATIRALEKARDDPSVLHNAGQLAAWYANESNPPKVTDRVLRLLVRMKSELAGKKPYTDAYKAVETACWKRQDIKRRFDSEIEMSEAELEQGKEAARAKQAEYNDLQADIKSSKRLLRSLRSELHGLEIADDSDEPHNILRRRRLRRRISDEEADLRDMERMVDRLRRQGRRIVADIKRKKAALARLRQESRKVEEKVKLPFRWLPPAVDGVVTPERNLPPSPATTTSAPAMTDSQTRAARQLGLARLYLRHEMKDKAVEILRGIVRDYVSTKAAEEAKKLLASLKPKPSQ